MKKIIITLAVLLLAVPAMADVTITLTPGPGPNDVTVSFSTSGEAELVRAIALDLQFSDPCAWIEDVNCADNSGYSIYPGSIVIDAGGNVTNPGSCGILDTNSMTSEQGSLYEIGVDTPPTPGDLFIVTLGGCGQIGSGGDVAITVSPNILRGGIVMEDASNPITVNMNGCTVNIGECEESNPCLACPGDICDTSTTGAPDGRVDFGDWSKLTTAMSNIGNPGDYFVIPMAGFECIDICDTSTTGPPDGRVDFGDWSKLTTVMQNTGNPGDMFLVPCF
jgi:hypothetical protein